MKILHIDTERSWRGGEQQLHYLVQGLARTEDDQIVAARPDSALAQRLREVSIPVFPVVPRWSGDGRVIRQLAGLIGDWQPDLLHAHTGHAHTLAWRVTRNNPVPLIVSRRVDFHRHKNPFSRAKFHTPRIRRYLAVSEAIGDILQLDGVPREKIRVVHSGVDLSRFQDQSPDRSFRLSLHLNDDIFLLGNIAALAPHKDQTTLIRAMRLVIMAAPRARLVIVGDGALKPQLEKWVRRLQLQEHVLFAGFQEDPVRVLRSLDLFVLSSRTEGLGTSVLDAMATPLPIVATRTGGIPEMIDDGTHGLLARPEDPVHLAEAILQLIHNPETATWLATNAQQRVREFSVEHTVTKTREVYQEVLEEEKS